MFCRIYLRKFFVTFVVESKAHVHETFSRGKIIRFMAFKQRDCEMLRQRIK